MKKFIFILFGGAMLFWANPTNAKPYYLYCNIYNNMQKGNKGSKAPKRPLCVDLTDNLLTTPRQVLGYTLNRKLTMSPSFITYSLPSLRTRPFALALAMVPQAFMSSKAMTSARMKPFSKSE